MARISAFNKPNQPLLPVHAVGQPPQQAQQFTDPSAFTQQLPSFQDFLQRGQQGNQFFGDRNIQEASQSFGSQFITQLQSLGLPAQAQQLASLNAILGRRGAIDPSIRAGLENQIGRGTQQQGLAAEQFSGRSGIRGPGQAAIQSGIQGSGQQRLSNLNLQLAIDQENRMRNDLLLAQNIVGGPGLQVAGFGNQGFLQQQQIDAQSGDELLQTLGVLFGAGANFFAPGTGGLVKGAITEGELDIFSELGAGSVFNT